METSTYLRQIRRLELMIANKTLEIENLESKATNMVAPTDKENVKSSGSQDKMAIFAIMAAEESKKVDAMKAKRDKIISQIDSISNTTSYDILTKFYVLNMDLKNIAIQQGYAESSIKTLKRNAMKEFERKYGDTYLTEKVREFAI